MLFLPKFGCHNNSLLPWKFGYHTEFADLENPTTDPRCCPFDECSQDARTHRWSDMLRNLPPVRPPLRSGVMYLERLAEKGELAAALTTDGTLSRSWRRSIGQYPSLASMMTATSTHSLQLTRCYIKTQNIMYRSNQLQRETDRKARERWWTE